MPFQPDLLRKDIDTARSQRDVGVQRVADKADDDNPGWGEIALQFLYWFAYNNRVFSAEEANDAAVQAGVPAPHSRKAWGQVYLTAQRKGWIERSTEIYQRRYGHAAPGIKWKSLVFGGTP